MKIKENFVLRQVADIWVVLPLSSATLNFDGMLNLNESGAMLWNQLEQGASREQLADVLISEYAISREIALNDVDEFIHNLLEAGCLDMQ